MYLKCIRANGFKSFADKIELNMNKGITGIVGPNGSGKSNILDAIRWVLGEQSAKALRSDSGMSDCIFAGSKSRGALSRASVSLTFDNSDHYLNSEFNDVEVKRILYKTGENEYYINNSKVRLKDITDLFLDTGAGKESFNIISQGAVADIINSKPEDRRVIFEEAAGVLKYKKRKEETFRKLDKTNENLERVGLLIDELVTTLEPLKEQSEIAHRYLDYKDDLKNIEIALIANDIEKINEEYKTLKNNVARLNSEVEQLTSSNTSDDSKLEQLKLLSLKVDAEIEEKNNLINGLTSELANLESKKQITIERQKYTVDDTKLQNNIIALKEELMSINNNYKVLEEEITTLTKELETKELMGLEVVKKQEENKKNRIQLVHDSEVLTKELMNLTNKIDILKENISNDTKLPYSVKAVINNVRLSGIRGVLGKLIQIEEKYVTAIEVSLGANSNVIVVDNPDNAKEAIKYLKEQKLGRATFFPISIIEGRSVPSNIIEKLKNVDGFIGTADSLVKYDDIFKNIVLNQLGNVLVVKDIETLNEVGKIVEYKYKIVSLDGEVQYSGGAITGGASKNSNSLLNQKYELDSLTLELETKDNELKILDKKIKTLDNDIEDINQSIINYQSETLMLKEKIKLKNNSFDLIKQQLNNKQNELDGTEKVVNNSLDDELEKILKEYYDKQALKEKWVNELSKLKNQKSDLSTEISSIEQTYREMNYQISLKQNELKNEEIKVSKYDVRLDNLLANLSENYGLTYEKAHSDYELSMEEGIARQTVNELKKKIKDLGDVNTGSILEYERLNERYEFLSKQREDLSSSVTSLMEVIDEMDKIMKANFSETFEKIKLEFREVFKKLFKGGEGILELTNPDDLLNTGVNILAVPPGKKLNSIALLSGGEKTLTAISLLFAILNVKPVPFVVLDEVEAALDEANVDAFGSYLMSRKDKSQFIIITHKKRTMEYADCLYGITMQESGVSKLVSVKLED